MVIHKLYKRDGDWVRVPRKTFENPVDTFGIPMVRKFNETKLDKLPYMNATLRTYQTEVVQETLQAYKNNLNTDAFIKAPCGSGKTVMAIAIMCELGVKTFITTPNSKLRDQWIKEIKKFTNLKVGKFVGSKKQEILDSNDVVVSTVQGVMKLPEKMFRDFSLLIVDEAHGSAAEVWSQSIVNFHGRRLLITATPKRTDGLETVLYRHCGGLTSDISIEMLRERGYVLTPHVLFIRHNKEYDFRLPWDYDSIDYATTYNVLAKDPSRRQLIKEVSERFIAKGHNIVYVSKRVSLVEWISENIPECCLLAGKRRDELTRHIAGSEKIVKEGLDKPDLSLAMVVTPVGNEGMFEQIGGRISRISEDPIQPVIVVIVDTDHSLFDIAQGKKLRNKTFTETSFAKNVRFARRLGMQVYFEQNGETYKVK